MNLHETVPFVIVLVICALTVKCDRNTHTDRIVPGGVSNADRPATPEINELVHGIHSDIKSHLVGVPGGANIIGEVIPISYRTQLVNGVNYFIKVRARTPKKMIFYHLKIYKSFNGTSELLKVAGPKGQYETIGYF